MITRDMLIAEIIRQHPETISVFKKFGLDCNECQIAAYEEIEHGAGVHSVNLDALLSELNRVVNSP